MGHRLCLYFVQTIIKISNTSPGCLNWRCAPVNEPLRPGGDDTEQGQVPLAAAPSPGESTSPAGPCPGTLGPRCVLSPLPPRGGGCAGRWRPGSSLGSRRFRGGSARSARPRGGHFPERSRGACSAAGGHSGRAPAAGLGGGRGTYGRRLPRWEDVFLLHRAAAGEGLAERSGAALRGSPRPGPALRRGLAPCPSGGARKARESRVAAGGAEFLPATFPRLWVSAGPQRGDERVGATAVWGPHREKRYINRRERKVE